MIESTKAESRSDVAAGAPSCDDANRVGSAPVDVSHGFEHAASLAKGLVVAGVLLLVLGLLFDHALVAKFHFRKPLSSEAIQETARTRLVFFAAGIVLLATGLLGRFGLGPGRWLERRGTARVVLASLSGLLPLLVIERAARPFVERLTSIYVSDAELGWKHRPGAEDTYWGAQVRINSHGMRGPDRAHAKPDGVRRVLVLGDSVVFGLAIEDDADTLPARLESELAARLGSPIECLNAGVCGWSPWQQEIFLAREGELWQPDLVVLGFVLNDVTERFALSRFGGQSEGAQLASTHDDGRPAWLAESGLFLSLRELALQRAFDRNAAPQFERDGRITPYHVIFQSDSAPVQRAWKVVLPELETILGWCRSRKVPLVLVVFPYTIQLTQPKADAPQWILANFAARRDLPCLDLLPHFVETARERQLTETDLFFDGLHPTRQGNQVAAEKLARFVVEQSILR